MLKWVEGKLIGHGTTGQVYEAMDMNAGTVFVVKKIVFVHPFYGLDQ